MKLIIYLILMTILLTTEPISGGPANPAPFTFIQPDNSSFQARQVGDERASHFETLDGYTIVQDETNWWNYANKDEKGKIIPINQRIGHVKPEKLGLPKHLHPSVTIIEFDNFTSESLTQTMAPQVGTKKAIVILINFTDVSQNADSIPSYFENLLFNASTGANSMHNYYKEVSYNKINITGDIAGNKWFTAFRDLAWYGADVTGRDANTNNADKNDWYIHKLAKDAVVAADPYVNYANYDSNGDGVIDNLIIVHAGNAQESTNVSTDIWSHMGEIKIWNGSAWNLGYMTNDGVRAVGYTMQAENSPLGMFSHEFGHLLGVPDLYDIDYSSSGVGDWDIMASGTWSNSGNTPSHFSAWSKYLLGWINPIKVTAPLLNEQISQSETSDDVYMLLDNPGDSPGNLDWASNGTGTGEYFLVENRKKIFYDTYIPGEGLLIWHIDESVGNNNNESHKLVDLEEADGLNHLDYNNTNNGDISDPWYNSIAGFTETANPNSKFYNGSASRTSVTNIGASESTMTASLFVPLSDWQYNRRLTITGSTSGAQTNYQMKLTVYNSPGTDTPGNVYLDGNAKSDFSDLRFTKSDGITLLDYWIESYTPGVSAVVWVEVDSIPASPGTANIYLYYGNPSATGASNGNNAFVFFDDFNDGTYTGWSLRAGNSILGVSNGWFTVQGTSSYGNVEVTADNSIVSNHAYELKIQTDFRNNSNRQGRFMFRSTSPYYNYVVGFYPTNIWLLRQTGLYSETILNGTTFYWDDTKVYNMKITGYGNQLKVYVNDVLTLSASDSTYSSGNIEVGNREVYGGIWKFDDTRVRKYSSPEPTWG